MVGVVIASKGTTKFSNRRMKRRTCLITLALALATTIARGDGFIYGFEGDVLPGEVGSGWIVADPCELGCSRRLENGSFILEWGDQGDIVNYHHWIAQESETQPPSLWIEWRFRSNQAKPATSSTCDAWLAFMYLGDYGTAYLFGDAVVDQSATHAALDLDNDVFHTFRFESADGTHYTIAVDGVVFKAWEEQRPPYNSYIQFGGRGSCSGFRPQPVHNEWDYIRYGTLADGERIVSADPAAGYLDPVTHSSLDRFTVTFDAPNYVYINQIAVQTTGTETPHVIATRRLQNGAPETVEIVLDRPLSPGEHTRFLFDDGTIENIVDYSFIPGDADGNGLVDLLESACFQNCFGRPASTGQCLAFDQNKDGVIDGGDVPSFSKSLGGPGK